MEIGLTARRASLDAFSWDRVDMWVRIEGYEYPLSPHGVPSNLEAFRVSDGGTGLHWL
jgi:hypothetical protein